MAEDSPKNQENQKSVTTQLERNLRQAKSRARLDNQRSLQQVLGDSLGAEPSPDGVEQVGDVVRSAVAGSGLGLDRLRPSDIEPKPEGNVIPLAGRKPRSRPAKPSSVPAGTQSGGARVVPFSKGSSAAPGQSGSAPKQPAPEVPGAQGSTSDSSPPASSDGESKGGDGGTGGGKADSSADMSQGALGSPEFGGDKKDDDKKKEGEKNDAAAGDQDKQTGQKDGDKKDDDQKKEGEKKDTAAGDQGSQSEKKDYPSQPNAIHRGLQAAKNRAKQNRYVQAADKAAGRVGGAARRGMDRTRRLAALPGEKLSAAKQRAGAAFRDSGAGRTAQRLGQGVKSAAGKVAGAPGVRHALKGGKHALAASKAVAKKAAQMKATANKIRSKAQYVLHPIEAMKLRAISWAIDSVAVLLLGVDVAPSRSARAILGNLFHMHESETFKKIIVPLSLLEFILWIGSMVLWAMIVGIVVTLALFLILVMAAPYLIGAAVLLSALEAIKGIFQ